MPLMEVKLLYCMPEDSEVSTPLKACKLLANEPKESSDFLPLNIEVYCPLENTCWKVELRKPKLWPYKNRTSPLYIIN